MFFPAFVLFFLAFCIAVTIFINKFALFLNHTIILYSIMRNRIYSILAAALVCVAALAQPKHEIRAVWLTTNSGLDWPKSTSQASQKSSLIEILDKLKAANFNTILLQVQAKGDVLWSSSYQPSMKVFTGNGNNNLSWEPCSFVIDECHKRGMECHAWIVPYRIGSASEAARYASNPRKHPYLAHPEWCISYGGALYLDPGHPEVREYLLNLYRELITNYDFDGTNFDYTRYPTSSLSDFDDSASFARYGNGMSHADWRRNNINTFVHEFYDMARSIKPRLKVGCAPIGTYKRAPGYGNMEAFGVFQDPVEWMNAGKQDIAFPQLYWNENYGFSPHMKMWAELTDYSRHIVAGLAPYKMADTNNWPVSEITGQIEKAREAEGVEGVCFFRTEQIIGSNSKYQQLYAELRDNYFKYPANIPPMPYLTGVTKPNAPTNVTISSSGRTHTVTWDAPAPAADGTEVKYYCVYRASRPLHINNIARCIGNFITTNSFTFTSDNDVEEVAVTAFDVNYYESDPAFQLASGLCATAGHTSISTVAGMLLVEAPAPIACATIFSASGSVVAKAVNPGSQFSLDISHLQHGCYLIKLQNEQNSVVVEKFIK